MKRKQIHPKKASDLHVSGSTNKETENKTNISLPMTGSSDAWMDDFEAPAFDSDDESTEKEQKEQKEKEQPSILTIAETSVTKLENEATISLPMTGASDAWMD